MSLKLRIFLLVLFCLSFRSLNSVAQKAIPLITMNENGEDGEDNFVLNPEAISMIKKLPSPIKVIAAIGDARVGKSTALSFIHYTLNNIGTSLAFHTKNAEEIFKTGNTMQAVTRGVWLSIVQTPGKDGMENVILLDVEGTDLGDDTVTDKLSIFTALTSSCLTLFMKEFPSGHILDFLYKIVRLSEEAFGKKETEHFPRLTAVLRSALAPPTGYNTIDSYIVDSLVAPKWRDKSDEKRKVIGKRFPKESISVFDLPMIPIARLSFDGILESKSHEYLKAIDRLTSELLELPVKRTLNGVLTDGQTLADLVERLVDVMNHSEKWKMLNTNFYELFEKEVCKNSAKKHIQPILEYSSQDIERQRLRAFTNFKLNCKLEGYVLDVDELIQSNLERQRKMEERERIERERQKEREGKEKAKRKEDENFRNGGLLGLIGGAAVYAGYAYLAPLLSDVRLKNNITLMNTSEYETIGLRGVEWVWNQDAERLGLSGKGSGVVAQEVELLYPWAVTEGYDGYKRVNYPALRLMIWAKSHII